MPFKKLSPTQGRALTRTGPGLKNNKTEETDDSYYFG